LFYIVAYLILRIACFVSGRGFSRAATPLFRVSRAGFSRRGAPETVSPLQRQLKSCRIPFLVSLAYIPCFISLSYIAILYSLASYPLLYIVAYLVLRIACFVSGHGFSRAAKPLYFGIQSGFSRVA